MAPPLSLEDEVAAAEALATGPILSRLKTLYDAELRRRHPSHLVKFRYASVLCCSPSRSLTRRGIEMLDELAALMRSEAQLRGKERALPPPAAADLTPRAPRPTLTQRARCASEEDGGFVLLRADAGAGSPAPDATAAAEEGLDGQSNSSDSECESEAEPSAGEPRVADSDSSPDADAAARFDAPDRVLLAGLDVSEARVPVQCRYFRALACYRLGEYGAALSACDDFLQEAAGAELAQGQRLRKACLFARVSRGALGVLVTLGVVLPAVLWHRGGLGAGGAQA